jgi:hypothetical protein
MPRTISLALLLCIASSCGGDANLVVHLKTVPGEDPFEGVEVLRVVLEHNQPGEKLFDHTYQASQTRFELPAVPSDGVVRLVVQGYESAVLNLLLASGYTPWIRPKSGETTQAEICFCKVETVEAGRCSCPPG